MAAKKKKKYTTVQITKEVRPILQKVARANKRSMTKQVEWLVAQEARRLNIAMPKKEIEDEIQNNSSR